MALLAAPASSSALVALPTQPDDVAWPTSEWPTGPIPAGVNGQRVEELLDQAFGPDPDPGFGESYATLIVQGGCIVAERYGPTSSVDTPHLSWSMAKSVTHALVGILVNEGRLDPLAPAAVPEWATPAALPVPADSVDQRTQITLDQLLRMVDGLDFCESYELSDADADSGPTPFSHCIDMLFGAGIDNHAGYAASRPAAHRPDTVFNYSSGTTNIVARIVCDLIGRTETGEKWMRERLFEPVGMASAKPTFDAAGNFVGSSYFHATTRDYARFGLLYLRGGSWDGRQVVPADWVDYGRTPRATDDEGRIYGAHWWLGDDDRGTFFPSGFEWQRVMCVPSSDLIVVRLGKTAEADYQTPAVWMNNLISEFDTLRNASTST